MAEIVSFSPTWSTDSKDIFDLINQKFEQCKSCLKIQDFTKAQKVANSLFLSQKPKLSFIVHEKLCKQFMDCLKKAVTDEDLIGLIYFLQRGVDLNVIEEKYQEPILAIMRSFDIFADRYAILSCFLIAAGANVNARFKDGTPILVYLAKVGDTNCTKLLLQDVHIDPNLQGGKHKNSALHAAATCLSYSGYDIIFELLHHPQTKPNVLNYKAKTPLQLIQDDPFADPWIIDAFLRDERIASTITKSQRDKLVDFVVKNDSDYVKSIDQYVHRKKLKGNKAQTEDWLSSDESQDSSQEEIEEMNEEEVSELIPRFEGLALQTSEMKLRKINPEGLSLPPLQKF